MQSTVRQFATEFFQSGKSGENGLPEPPLGRATYAASGVINLLALALPLTILQVYDRVLPNAAFDTLTALIILLISAVLIDGLLKYFRATVVNWSAASFTHRLSVRALSSMLGARPSAFGKVTASEHLERLNAISGLGNHLSSQSRAVQVDMLFIPVFSAVIILVGGWIFGAVVALFAAFGFLGLRGTKTLNAVIGERETLDARKQDFVIDVLRAIPTVKACAMEPQIMRRFERLQSAASLVTQKMIRLTGTAQTYNNAYAALSTVVIVAAGTVLVLNGRLTLGALACCMLLSSQLLQPLMRSLASWNEIKLAQHRRDRVAAIFSDCGDHSPAEARYPKRFKPKKVTLKNLSVRYGDAAPLFHGVNLEIEAGAFIAIKGADGSGRSSLLRAIIQDAPVAEGEIIIGDEASGIVPPSQVRRSVRYVGPAPTVFRGAILDNITLFGEIPAKTALAASKFIGLDDEVVRIPLGYDTMLRSAASRDVPPPTAQRITLARALAMLPSVLILDEANALLDIAGEQRLIEALEKLRGRATIILAAHRPSLLRLADKVYEISGGALIEAAAEPREQRPAAS